MQRRSEGGELLGVCDFDVIQPPGDAQNDYRNRIIDNLTVIRWNHKIGTRRVKGLIVLVFGLRDFPCVLPRDGVHQGSAAALIQKDVKRSQRLHALVEKRVQCASGDQNIGLRRCGENFVNWANAVGRVDVWLASLESVQGEVGAQLEAGEHAVAVGPGGLSGAVDGLEGCGERAVRLERVEGGCLGVAGFVVLEAEQRVGFPGGSGLVAELFEEGLDGEALSEKCPGEHEGKLRKEYKGVIGGILSINRKYQGVNLCEYNDIMTLKSVGIRWKSAECVRLHLERSKGEILENRFYENLHFDNISNDDKMSFHNSISRDSHDSWSVT